MTAVAPLALSSNENNIGRTPSDAARKTPNHESSLLVFSVGQLYASTSSTNLSLPVLRALHRILDGNQDPLFGNACLPAGRLVSYIMLFAVLIIE
jgi:hypothetical protein